jgi:RNA recognition motif-containing protein
MLEAKPHCCARIADPAVYSDDRGPEFSIFVGDLGPEVNEFVLVSLFQSRFPSCKSAKIMTDAMTGQSRGYGFVRFAEESDQQRALVEMQGVYCGNRPMRISTATPKTRFVISRVTEPRTLADLE